MQVATQKDANGNWIAWTGRPSKPERTYGGRFEVLHSSASGWYVFDCYANRVSGDGLGSIANATKLARKLAFEAAKETGRAANVAMT